MWSVPRFAVVPTHNRPDDLASLVCALAPQCDVVVVVDNASDPPVDGALLHRASLAAASPAASVTVVSDSEQPPNLSRLWNVGLEACMTVVLGMVPLDTYLFAPGVPAWDVAVLNDDAIIPPGWFAAVSHALRAHPTATVACTGQYEPVDAPLLKTGSDGDLYRRMTPWAFVTKGEVGLRADERLRWWYQDTDWDWRARRAGGVLIVPGPIVINSKANSSTVGVLAEQAGRDRDMFAQIHGGVPW